MLPQKVPLLQGAPAVQPFCSTAAAHASVTISHIIAKLQRSTYLPDLTTTTSCTPAAGQQNRLHADMLSG
jgi:hypothetical protein